MNRRHLTIGAPLLAAVSLLVYRSLETRDSIASNTARVTSHAAARSDAASHGGQPSHPAHGPDEIFASQALRPANPRKADLTADFLDGIVKDSKVEFSLPDGRILISEGARIERDAKGVVRISGKISAPQPGSIFLQRQDFSGVAGQMVGHVLFEKSETAWKIVPEGSGGAPVLMEVLPSAVACMNLPLPAEMPQDHPDSSTVANPPYQAVIPLQSLPGATGVIYLDFDGEKGPFPGWYDGDAAHSRFDNNTIRDIWIRVAEDYLPFNLNVTTDVKIWQAAPQGQRIRCIITPTNFYNAGGVAYVGSFNWGGEPTCWAMNYSGDGAATVIPHEVGHTLGLYHHGHNGSEYYGGQGSGTTSWAPIMGSGYGRNLKQWSNGDYNLATKPWQNDLAIISSQNNGVAYRADDGGDTLATATYLNIASGGTVTNQQGIIGSTGEVDAFRFTTSGGAVNLSITTTTSYSPNLDIYAELVNASTGVQVISSNAADPELNETLTTTLPAGEYLLKITGTGYPSPTDNTGYSNYGSLGSYRIDGTVSGGQNFQGFTINENLANGTSLGAVTPVSLSGNLSYTISSGNPGGAFAINSSTGNLIVANSAELNFETLSTRFDDPATIELFVTISNSSGGSETVRVLVAVTDVNEAPVASGPGGIIMLENTIAGNILGIVTGSDPDRFDYPLYSIISGNSAGYFAIDAVTGQLTVASPPSVSADTSYNLVVQAIDTKGMSTTTTVNVTVLNLPAGFTPSPGGLYRTFFNNISGSAVSDLTSNAAFPNSPDQQIFLTSFDGGGYSDNYGSTIRGYLIPPSTGAYTFYIASDDSAQLILGTGSAQVSTPVIAYNDTWTNQYAWDAVPSATSASYNLTAGQPYYIEMRQKESLGGDHAAVAWSGPGISRQVIPGRYLAPFYQNYAPRPSGSLSVSEVASVGTVIGKLPVIEVNNQDQLSNYAITAGNQAGLFAIDPATGDVTLAQAGQFNAAATPYYDITVAVTDNGTPALRGSGVVRINVIPYTLYFDPNGVSAGSVVDGGSYSWIGNNWTPAQGGVSVSSAWISGAKATFAASFPGSPLAYDVSVAGYNSGVNGGISAIDALNGTVSFTGNVDNFYLINPMTVRAASGAAIRFNQTSNAPVLAFNLNSQTATFEGDIAFSSNTAIGNSGNVVLTSGTLGLNAPNIYTGSTTINGGVLALSGSGQLYSTLNWGNATITVNSGGVLQCDQDSNLGQLGYNQANLVLNGGTWRYTGNSNITTEGRGFIIGVGGATLESLAPVGQTWNINNDSRSSSYGIASNGGALTLSGIGNGQMTKVISGSGALIKSGTGTWTLGATNTYTGGTTVNGGTLLCNSSANLPGAVTIAGDSGSGAGTLHMNQPNIVTWSQNVSGGGRWLVATGSGSQTVSLTGNYAGFTGVLEVTSGSGKINLATASRYPSSSATLRLTANTAAYITGGNTLASKIELYGGSIGEPAFGQLRVASSNLTLSGAVKLFGNTSIAVDSPSNRSATFSGVISESGGSFGFTKNQSGTLTLSGNNTYSGGTTHAAGVLRTGTSGGTFGIGNLTVADGQTTQIRHAAGNALGRQAYVYLNGTTSALSISAGATETVSRLYMNGVRQANGSYNSGRITGGGTLVVGEIAPNAPTALTVSANSPVSLQLAWTHASVNDLAIKIERSLAVGSGFAEVASLAGSARSFVDSELEANTTYYYRIRAVNAVGNSSYSSVVSAMTLLPAAPTGLTATAGAGQVSLSWVPSIGAVNYVVRRATNAGGPYSDVAISSAASFLDTGLLDMTYYYVVAGISANGGIGGQSPEVSVKPSLADSDGVWNLASSGNWMTPGNWENSVIAIGVDRIASFPLAAGGTINQNRTGLSIGSLSFSNGNYTISGNELTLDTSTGKPGVFVGSGVTATIASSVNGNDGLSKTGAGLLKLTAYNNYSGSTTVNGGTLELSGASGGTGLITGNVTVNPGATLTLTAGDGTGFGWDHNVSGLAINGGILNAIGGSHIGFGSYASVAMTSGGTISGNWQWNGDGMLGFSSSGGSTNTISGNLVLRADSGANHTFNVADGASATDLQVDANLSDQYPEVWWASASNLVKTGAGTMVVSGNNSFDGITEIQAGTLVAASNNALGAGGHNGATMSFIYDGATLALQGGIVSNEHFHVWGAGADGLGALRNLSGDNALTDSYVLRSNVTVGVDVDTLTVPFFYESGGSFSMTKVGAGTLTLTGGNSYTGGTIVSGGVLELKNTAWILGNVGGLGVTVSNNAVLRANNSVANQLNGLTLNGGTVEAINSNGNSDWGDFFLTGNVTATGISTLDADIALRASNVNFDVTTDSVLTVGGVLHNGAFFGIYSGSPANVIKTGLGKLVIKGNSNYTGTTSVSGGTLKVDGRIGSSLVTVTSAALAGNGSIGSAVQLNTGGNMEARIADWTGIAGTGFEDLSVQSLAIQNGTPHVITVDTSGLKNFSESAKTFPILLSTGGITGFSAANFTVSAPGFPGTGNWTVQKTGNKLELVYTPTAYEIWAAAKGLTATNRSMSMDPDHDGLNNLQEFAFDGDPLNPTVEAKSFSGLADPDGAGPLGVSLILTIPVRNAAIFQGPGDLVSIPVDGILYRIQGSADLVDFTTTNIREVTPALSSGLPSLSSGWSYRTFLAPGPEGSTHARNFIRVTVESQP